jgi:hypothetical protein
MRLDVLPHSTGRHPECPGDLLQCEQLQRGGHGTNSIHTTSSGTRTEIAVSSAEPMDGFRAMSGSLLIGSEFIGLIAPYVPARTPLAGKQLKLGEAGYIASISA